MKLHGQLATKLALYLAKHADPVQVQAAVERTEGWERNTERARSNYALVSETQEYNYGKREEMTSDARALCQTFGIASNILGKFANYCVGNGEVCFFTDDSTWDEQAEALVKQQFAIIDPTGEHDMVSMAKLGIISKKRDGDIGFVKTLDSGWPQLQAIEADRIRNDQNMVNVDSSLTQVGGVKLMPNGKPISYRVWERNLWNGFKNPREISARDFILYRNKNRFDGVRGITSFERGGLNRLRDVKEILAAESKSLKTLSKFAIWWTKMAGGVRNAGVNLFPSKTKDDGSGLVYTEELKDGTTAYGLPGEQASSFKSDRPGTNFLPMLEFLIRDIAVSLELPVGFVWSMVGIGGPAVRLESKQAERTFKAEIEAMERTLIDPTVAWIINWAMSPEVRLLPFNPKWMRFEASRPSHPSIDVGRESKADMDELDHGITSQVDLSAERGLNAFKVLTKKAKFAQFAMKTAEKYKVPLEMLLPPKFPPQQEPKDENADTETDKAKEAA